MGGQISWLIPAALIGLVAVLWLSRRAPRTDRIRAAALLWGGWLVLTGLVFSYMSGIIHPYYTIALAPAIAALTGMSAVALWRVRDRLAARLTLTAMLAVTAAWAWVLLGRSTGSYPWLRAVVALAAAGAAGLVLSARAVGGRRPGDHGFAALTPAARGRRFLTVAPLSLAMIAGLAGPVAYSITTDATSHTGAIPSAGPSVAGGFGGPGGALGAGGTRGAPGRAGGAVAGTGPVGAGRFPGGAGGPGGAGRAGGGLGGGGLGGNTQVSGALTTLLKNGAAGYTWVAATVGAESAAPFQLASGDPIMAIGGFNGTDQTPSLAQFEKYVSEHKIHYFIGQNQASFGGGSGDAAQITAWVAKHFTSQTVGGVTIYNLTSPKSS